MRLRDEIRKNVTVHSRNMAELHRSIQYIGDSLVVLEEWDWHWPRGVRLAPTEEQHFRSEGWQNAVTPALRERINRLYALLKDAPPRLDRWENEWDGRLPLAVFLSGKLAQREREICNLGEGVIAELDRLIHPSSPSPTPEHT
jgi:hypothetical protein